MHPTSDAFWYKYISTQIYNKRKILEEANQHKIKALFIHQCLDHCPDSISSLSAKDY